MPLIILLFLACLILFFVLIFISVQFYYVIFRGYAPFISSRPGVINKILAEIDLSGGGKVYELGCGKAGFLRAVGAKFPKVEAIGVENSPWPYFIAIMQASMSKNNIKILNKDLYKVNLADADLIYTYLNPEMMGKLEKKFKQECRPGTEIISNGFSLPKTQPRKVIDKKEGGKIYFYIL